MSNVHGFQNMGKTTTKSLQNKIWGESKKSYSVSKMFLLNLDAFKYYSQEANGQANSEKPMSEMGRFKHGCPLDKDDLGHSTWNLLHTMAAVYPEKPTVSQKEDVKNFFSILSRTYPCDVCAKDLAKE